MPPKMEELRVHIRLVMWEFKNNNKSTETAENIFSAYD